MFHVQNLRNVQESIKNERENMKNVVLKNITDKADELAQEWNRTRNPKAKEEWFKLVGQISELFRKQTLDKDHSY